MPQAKPAAKPAVKPAAKPVAPAASEVITPEDVGSLDDILNEPEAPEKPLMSGDTFTVKNTGKNLLCLTNGSIKSGNEGLATVAEFSMLSAFMEKV